MFVFPGPGEKSWTPVTERQKSPIPLWVKQALLLQLDGDAGGSLFPTPENYELPGWSQSGERCLRPGPVSQKLPQRGDSYEVFLQGTMRQGRQVSLSILGWGGAMVRMFVLQNAR